MKKPTCVLVALAFVAVANAEINLWLSETGITDPTHQFTKTTYDFMKPMIFDTTGGAPLATPVDMGSCCGEIERVFFVWGEFTYPEEVWYEKLYGLHIVAQATGCMTLEDSVIYRHQGGSVKSPQWTRWDGDLDLVMGPGCEGFPVPAAVATDGIRYDYGIQGTPFTPQTYDMRIYDPATFHTRFLIGAIKVKCNCESAQNPEPFWPGELYVGLGTLGIISNGAMTGGAFFPDVYYNGVLLQSGNVPPAECQWTLAAYCTPEPTAIVLIAACGLLLRRR